MKLKIVQVGCGWMPSAGHGPALARYAKENPDRVELAACCDINEESAKQHAADFGYARTYTDMAQMLDAEEPGFVNLAVPVSLTAPMGLQVFERKIPMLLEKPPGVDVPQARQLEQASVGVPHRVAFNRRYTPLIVKLCEKIAETGLPIMSTHCEFLRVNRPDPDFSSTAIHGIDAVAHIAGPYQRLNFTYRELPEANLGAVPGVANMHVQAQMQNGGVATLDFCPVSGYSAERYTVHVHNTSFFMAMPGGAEGEGYLKIFHRGKLTETILGGTLVEGCSENYMTNGFYGENASFLDALLAGQPISGGMNEAAIAPMIITDAMRSRESFCEL